MDIILLVDLVRIRGQTKLSHRRGIMHPLVNCSNVHLVRLGMCLDWHSSIKITVVVVVAEDTFHVRGCVVVVTIVQQDRRAKWKPHAEGINFVLLEVHSLYS